MIIDAPVSDLETRFLEVQARGEDSQRVGAFKHLGSRHILGGKAFIFDTPDRTKLAGLGEFHTPSIADLFVAAIEGEMS